MKNRIVLGVLVFLVLFLTCFLPIFAYYSFLSPEANIALENLREKHRVKEIVLEKGKGIVWTVILPKNDGVEISEVKEAVYNNETGKFEAVYTFTGVVIINPKGWIKVVWGLAAKFYLYDMPRICVRFDS
jgi:hypothetical protein